jgi:hypothetical protein
MGCASFGVTVSDGEKSRVNRVIRNYFAATCYGFLGSQNLVSMAPTWRDQEYFDSKIGTLLIHCDVPIPGTLDGSLSRALKTLEEFVNSQMFQRLTGGVLHFGPASDFGGFLGDPYNPHFPRERYYRVVIRGHVQAPRTLTALRLLNFYLNNQQLGNLPDECLKYVPFVYNMQGSFALVYNDTYITQSPLSVGHLKGMIEGGGREDWFIERTNNVCGIRMGTTLTIEHLAELWNRTEQDYDRLCKGWKPLATHGYTKDIHFLENAEDGRLRFLNKYDPEMIISVGAPLSRTEMTPGEDISRMSFNNILVRLHQYLQQRGA